MPDERMEINEISMMMKYEGNPKTTSSIQWWSSKNNGNNEIREIL
jgi:hypothetical protein